MDQFTFFTNVWQTIAVPLDAGTAQVVQALAGWVDGRFQLCVIAYFIITLLIASWSSDEEAFQRFFRQIFLASVLFTMASNAGTYNYYVTNLVHGVVGSISQAVATFFDNKQQVNADGFDALASQIFALGIAVYKQLPAYSLKAVGLVFMIGMYWLSGLLAVALMFVVYMSAYIVTDILLAIGPLFVALYFFPFTRQWFHGWLRNLMTGILAQVFSVVVVAFFFAAMTSVLTTAGRSVAAAGSLSAEVAVGILLLLMATAAICFLYNFIAIYMVYMAASIAGGLAPPQPRLVRLGGGMAAERNFAGGYSAAAAAPTQAGVPTQVPTPPRDYAFNRTVGSAP